MMLSGAACSAAATTRGGAVSRASTSSSSCAFKCVAHVGGAAQRARKRLGLGMRAGLSGSSLVVKSAATQRTHTGVRRGLHVVAQASPEDSTGIIDAGSMEVRPSLSWTSQSWFCRGVLSWFCQTFQNLHFFFSPPSCKRRLTSLLSPPYPTPPHPARSSRPSRS